MEYKKIKNLLSLLIVFSSSQLLTSGWEILSNDGVESLSSEDDKDSTLFLGSERYFRIAKSAYNLLAVGTHSEDDETERLDIMTNQQIADNVTAALVDANIVNSKRNYSYSELIEILLYQGLIKSNPRFKLTKKQTWRRDPANVIIRHLINQNVIITEIDFLVEEVTAPEIGELLGITNERKKESLFYPKSREPIPYKILSKYRKFGKR